MKLQQVFFCSLLVHRAPCNGCIFWGGVNFRGPDPSGISKESNLPPYAGVPILLGGLVPFIYSHTKIHAWKTLLYTSDLLAFRKGSSG